MSSSSGAAEEEAAVGLSFRELLIFCLSVFSLFTWIDRRMLYFLCRSSSSLRTTLSFGDKGEGAEGDIGVDAVE
jgi:hypothetical protein